MASKKTQPKDLQKQLTEKATDFMVAEQKLLKSYGLGRTLVVNFPKCKRVPFTGWLAVKLLKWSGGVIDTKFGLITKK